MTWKLLGTSQLNESHESHCQPWVKGKHWPSCAIIHRIFCCLVLNSWMNLINLITNQQWQADTVRHVLSAREYSIVWYQSAESKSHYQVLCEGQTLPSLYNNPHIFLLKAIHLVQMPTEKGLLLFLKGFPFVCEVFLDTTLLTTFCTPWGWRGAW